MYHEAEKLTPNVPKALQGSCHVRHVHIAGDMNNNKTGRLNGEVRDIEKVMREVKTIDSPIFEEYKLYHNCVR